jgi:hypothetical protein
MAAQAFRASRRASALRLRVFHWSPPALERRLTAFPKAQNKASIAYDGVIRARICSPRNGVHRLFCTAAILRSVCRRWVNRYRNAIPPSRPLFSIADIRRKRRAFSSLTASGHQPRLVADDFGLGSLESRSLATPKKGATGSWGRVRRTKTNQWLGLRTRSVPRIFHGLRQSAANLVNPIATPLLFPPIARGQRNRIRVRLALSGLECSLMAPEAEV